MRCSLSIKAALSYHFDISICELLMAREFGWKDRLTISISLIALLVSGVSAYYSLFWVEVSASSVVLRADLNKNENVLIATVAVLNTGNRQLAVTDVQLMLATSKTSYYGLNAQLTQADTTSLPVIIEPSNVRLFSIKANLPVEKVVQSAKTFDDVVGAREAATVIVKIDALGATGDQLTGQQNEIRVYVASETLSGYFIDQRIHALQPVVWQGSGF